MREIRSATNGHELLSLGKQKIRVLAGGNLNPAAILAEKSPEEIYVLSLQLCKETADCSGLILASGCAPSPIIPRENFKDMRKVVDDFNAGIA